jgi:hypothetical protein
MPPVTEPSLWQNYASTEKWSAFVNESDAGITVYTPFSYTMVSGFHAEGSSGPGGSGTNYMHPIVAGNFGPGTSLESEIYLIPGNYRNARQIIYSLQETAVPDVLPPFLTSDTPNSACGPP